MQDSTRYQRHQGRYLTGGKSTSKYVQINWELVESQKYEQTSSILFKLHQLRE